MCNLYILCICMFVDPTMTQTFLNHFNCRIISEATSVLQKDYAVECSRPSWYGLAVVSVLGLVIVSVGFPVAMMVWMRKVMAEELRKVRHEGKTRAEAYRDFGRKFSYISVREHDTLRIRTHVHMNTC